MIKSNVLFRKEIELLSEIKSILSKPVDTAFDIYIKEIRGAIPDLFYDSAFNLNSQLVSILPVKKLSQYRMLIDFLMNVSGSGSGIGGGVFSSARGGERSVNDLFACISDLENEIKHQLSLRSQFTVFYSWQSDTASGTNRNFIENSLNAALNKVNKDSILSLSLDKDTRGENGSPDIFPTIKNKIDNAIAFVADVTPIIKKDSKEIPNPNVMCELGYALSSLSDERVIIICNTASCELKQLPFDIGLKRALTYSLSTDCTQEEKKKEKDRIVEVLSTALKQIRDM